MNRNRILAEAQRDQRWAELRRQFAALNRIAEGEALPGDEAIIPWVCSVVVMELIYREAVVREDGVV